MEWTDEQLRLGREWINMQRAIGEGLPLITREKAMELEAQVHKELAKALGSPEWEKGVCPRCMELMVYLLNKDQNNER